MSDSANPDQQQAISSDSQHILVLAGAGSGKTRVLVQRIAHLVQQGHCSPMEILAVTFTNKAAKEILARLENLLQMPVRGLWVGTFHGLAHRFLRQHYEAAHLPQNFQILDSDDQLRLIKRLQKELNIDDERFPAKQIQWFINNQKENGRRAEHVQPDGQPFTEVMLSLYQQYEAHCQRNGLVDFTELLLRCHETLRDNTELLHHYQNRFRHKLIDEFQDTNTLQYAWLRLLTTDHNSLFAVGDDDQSIYSWRGAKIENIHRFSRDFPDTEIIRLEQNYRSTETILAAANALIANNDQRMGKSLWTQDNPGSPIDLYAAFNEFDEALFVTQRIEHLKANDTPFEDIAILYRANAQSRVLEESLNRAGIPYRIYGGHKFFARAEIKDALAYLRLINFPNDDPSFERIVNMPPRGIGHATLDKVRDFAQINQMSLWEACRGLLNENGLDGRASKALSNFLLLITELKEQHDGLELSEQTATLLDASGLLDHFKSDRSERSQAKAENLQELINATRQFVPDPDSILSPVDEFLAHVALDTSDDNDSSEHCVQMMTLHSAKGLEFENVFMTGVEEGLFPHHMCAGSPDQLEEERRLCYVGMTRAKKHLTMCYAEHRRVNGRDQYPKPSRFIEEIPEHLFRHVRAKSTPQSNRMHGSQRYVTSGSSPEPSSRHSLPNHTIRATNYSLGQSVNHAKFGQGTIINFEGQGESARVQIQFDRFGSKWLVLQYANLT